MSVCVWMCSQPFQIKVNIINHLKRQQIGRWYKRRTTGNKLDALTVISRSRSYKFSCWADATKSHTKEMVKQSSLLTELWKWRHYKADVSLCCKKPQSLRFNKQIYSPGVVVLSHSVPLWRFSPMNLKYTNSQGSSVQHLHLYHLPCNDISKDRMTSARTRAVTGYTLQLTFPLRHNSPEVC